MMYLYLIAMLVMPIYYIFKSNDASIKTTKENTGNGWVRFTMGIPVCIITEYVEGNQLPGIEICSIYKYIEYNYYNIICGVAIKDDFTQFKRLVNQDIIIWYIPF